MASSNYLHVCSGGEINSYTKVGDKSIHPMVVEDVGLELSDWPVDDLFQSWPVFFATSRLAAKIMHEKFSSIDPHNASRVIAGFNFKAFYPAFYPGEINVPFTEYFNADRKNIWMELERKKLIEKGLTFR